MSNIADEILRHRGSAACNDLTNILNNLNDLETAMSITSTSPYIDTSNINTYMKDFKNSFTVLTLNIQSLHAKFDKLAQFIQ